MGGGACLKPGWSCWRRRGRRGSPARRSGCPPPRRSTGSLSSGLGLGLGLGLTLTLTLTWPLTLTLTWRPTLTLTLTLTFRARVLAEVCGAPRHARGVGVLRRDQLVHHLVTVRLRVRVRVRVRLRTLTLTLTLNPNPKPKPKPKPNPSHLVIVPQVPHAVTREHEARLAPLALGDPRERHHLVRVRVG